MTTSELGAAFDGRAEKIRVVSASRESHAEFLTRTALEDRSIVENLSGVVGHGKGFPPTTLGVYGPPLQEVKLLDGLLLACSSSTLRESGLRFDEDFDFVFYDMDFCRQAEIKTLRMGTCKLSVVHESGGRFRGEGWRAAFETYLRKWGS